MLVLERQAQPGGCLQSYRRGNFEFDTGLHYVGGLAEGQPLHEAFEQLGLMQLPWVRLDADGFDQVTIGNQTFPLAEGFDHFASVLGEYFPQEKTALRQYVDTLRHLPPMEDIVEVNAYDWLSSLFHDPLLINVLSAAAMKMELRRESLPLFNFAHSMSSYIQSSLVNDIKSFGGEVVCRAEVEELVEQDGRIVAAKCSKGQTYEAKAFISDVHPQLTFGWLKDSRIMKGIFRRRINALENTFGMFTASLVLKPDVLPYFNHNKYVYKKANVWSFHEDMDGVGGVMVSCRVPENGDYTRQIDLLTPMPWTLCKDWEDTHVGRRGDIYEQQKQRMADECIRLAERVIPGLRDMVENATPHSDHGSEKCYTSTPLTWRDYTLSPCGSAFGIRKDCRQSLITMLSPKTPIPNLFLTGQSLVLHGLEGVTMTAFKTLETIKNEKL